MAESQEENNGHESTAEQLNHQYRIGQLWLIGWTVFFTLLSVFGLTLVLSYYKQEQILIESLRLLLAAGGGVAGGVILGSRGK